MEAFNASCTAVLGLDLAKIWVCRRAQKEGSVILIAWIFLMYIFKSKFAFASALVFFFITDYATCHLWPVTCVTVCACHSCPSARDCPLFVPSMLKFLFVSLSKQAPLSLVCLL